MNGKGSNPRPFSNYKQYCENWDEIKWDNNIYCYNCGMKIEKENLTKYPEYYKIHDDGEIEHLNCNYN